MRFGKTQSSKKPKKSNSIQNSIFQTKLDLKVKKLDLKVIKLDLKVKKLDLKVKKLDFSAFWLSAVGWNSAQKKALPPYLEVAF